MTEDRSGPAEDASRTENRARVAASSRTDDVAQPRVVTWSRTDDLVGLLGLISPEVE